MDGNFYYNFPTAASFIGKLVLPRAVCPCNKILHRTSQLCMDAYIFRMCMHEKAYSEHAKTYTEHTHVQRTFQKKCDFGTEPGNSILYCPHGEARTREAQRRRATGPALSATLAGAPQPRWTFSPQRRGRTIITDHLALAIFIPVCVFCIIQFFKPSFGR